MKGKSTYTTEVFELWRYVAENYGSRDQLPLLVVLQNCTTTRGNVLIERIELDEARERVTLVTSGGPIEVNESEPWTIKAGKTNAGTGRTIFTHHLE